jgi:periplasmic divalent cation tolerance protein
MTRPAAALVWCPFPDRESAREAATALLDENLIACANILGAIESLFVWQGKQSSGEEIGVLFKTVPGVSERAVSRLGELHPYDTPAIIGWDCAVVHPLTANWLEQQMGSRSA